MRLGLLLKRGQPQAPQIAAELTAAVARKGHTVVVPAEEGRVFDGAPAVPAAEFARAIDVLVVLGGDGTFLHGANLVSDAGVPLLGINLGSLGFMTHYALSEAHAAVAAACDGMLTVVERMRLRVTVRSGGQEIESRNALNEAVITQRGQVRLLDLAAQLDGSDMTTYKADGLIISTPTGSTAYNLAAGGPILTPDLEAIVLTPICPHTLTNRPVVMRPDARLVVTNVSSAPASLSTDGQWSYELAQGDSVEVRKADRPLRTFRGHEFFAVLRKKLSWGERAG